MRFRNSNWPALLLLWCLRLSAQSVSPVAFSESQDDIPAFSDSGPITLPATHLKVNLGYASGKKEQGDLVVVHDLQGRHYFWRYQGLSSPDDKASWLSSFKSGSAAAYVSSDKLIVFEDNMVTEDRTQSNSLKDAVAAATNEIVAKLPDHPSRRTDAVYMNLKGGPPLMGLNLPDTKLPSTFAPIPSEFWCEPGNAICTGIMRYVSISKEGKNWRLVLRNRWDVEVIVDEKYTPISSRQLTKPPK